MLQLWKRGYRAWQTSRCPDYKRRQAQLEERRKALEGISLNWKAERDHPIPLPPTKASTKPTSTNEMLAGRKRDRPSQSETAPDDASSPLGGVTVCGFQEWPLLDCIR